MLTIRAGQELVTHDGMLVGTPAYMSPEQFLGSPADARSDQFSYFVALYEALHGHLPFEGKTLSERVINITSGTRVPSPATSMVPRAVDKVIDRGLRARCEERWPTMRQALEALKAATGRGPRPWRRRVTWGLGVAVVLGASTLGVQWRVQSALDERRELCRGAEKALVGVWDPERRARVKRAFLETGLPYAGDTWKSVAMRLDERASAWATMHTEACESTHLRGEQSTTLLDLRMACLQRHRLEMRSLVDVYMEADSGTVEHAVEALEGLSKLAQCADTTRLLSSPTRAHDESDPQVVAVLEGIAQASSLELSANFSLALERVLEASIGATSTGSRALIAETRLLEGQIRDALGEPAAGKALEDAFFIAEELDDAMLPASAALELMHYETTRLNVDVADVWARHSRALIVRLSERDRLECSFLDTSYWLALGTLSSKKGNLEAAEAQYRQGLQQIESVPGEKRLWVAGVRNNLGNLLVLRGDLDEAEEELERAARIYLDLLGEHHPLYAAALNNIATLHMHRGEWHRARGVFEKALSVFEAALGQAHPNVGVVEDNLGDVANRLGDLSMASDHYDRSVGIFVEALGPDSPALAYPLTGIGEIKLKQGDELAAREVLERALALRRDDKSHEGARTRFALARALGGDAHQRAVQLAEDARTAYMEAGSSYALEVDEIRSWIESASSTHESFELSRESSASSRRR